MSTPTIESAKDRIEDTIKATTEALSARVQPHIDAGKRRVQSLDGQARALINQHPVACLAGAVALGYLVARLARRERS